MADSAGSLADSSTSSRWTWTSGMGLPFEDFTFGVIVSLYSPIWIFRIPPKQEIFTLWLFSQWPFDQMDKWVELEFLDEPHEKHNLKLSAHKFPRNKKFIIEKQRMLSQAHILRKLAQHSLLTPQMQPNRHFKNIYWIIVSANLLGWLISCCVCRSPNHKRLWHLHFTQLASLDSPFQCVYFDWRLYLIPRAAQPLRNVSVSCVV